jgi:hypothetical protein
LCKWIVALVLTVIELKTGAAKLALVDTCIVYLTTPSGSLEAAQLNVGEVTVVVDPLTGTVCEGTVGGVVSILTVQVLDHAL